MSLITKRVGPASSGLPGRMSGVQTSSGIAPLMGEAATVTQATADNRSNGFGGSDSRGLDGSAMRQARVDPISGRDRGAGADMANPEADPGIGHHFDSVVQLDPASGTYVLKTFDLVSDELVSQIPEESWLRMRKALKSWQAADTSADGAAIDKLS